MRSHAACTRCTTVQRKSTHTVKVRRSSKASGFTIIEVLIVVMIIAFLAGMAVPYWEENLATSRDAKRKADLRVMVLALEAYNRTNGEYPDTLGVWRGDAPAFGGFGYDAAGYIPGLVPTFMQALPKDPDSNYPAGDQGYVYNSDGTDFKLIANQLAESIGAGDPFYDPQRPGDTFAFSTPGAYNW